MASKFDEVIDNLVAAHLASPTDNNRQLKQRVVDQRMREGDVDLAERETAVVTSVSEAMVKLKDQPEAVAALTRIIRRVSPGPDQS